MAVAVEIATEFRQRRAENGILSVPGTVHGFRLQEAGEACVDVLDRRSLICAEEVVPIFRTLGVFLVVSCSTHALRHLRNAEVVVGVFHSAGYAASSEALMQVGIGVVEGNVVKVFPAL